MWRMKYTIVMNLRILPDVLEKMHRMVDRPEQYTEEEKYGIVRYVTNVMQKTGFIKTKGLGMENLPSEGGYVIYPNHQGKFDAYSIVSVHEKPLTVVMDREMSYFPLVDEIINVLKGKRLDLNDTRQAMKVITEIVGEVSQGRRYIIFPEGGYSNEKRNNLWDFKAGCFNAAMKAGAPIVPTVLVDSYKPYNSWKIMPVKTQVHFLKPIYKEEYQGLKTTQVSEMVQERIQNKLNELGYAR